MITRRYLAAAVIAIVAVVATTAPRAPAKNRTTPWLTSSNASYVSLPRIVKEYAHDSGAFTQGLVFGADGALYESDGLYRKSRVRRVELDTGKTLAKNLNANEHFGEGLAAIGEKLYQLTWREGAMHEYDTKTLRRLSTRAQPFHGEGWGLAYDETTGLAYGTDGTHRVHVLRPAHNWAALHVLRVKDERLGDTLIEGLNELEMVEGELWANVLPLRYHKASPCVGLRCRHMRRLRKPIPKHTGRPHRYQHGLGARLGRPLGPARQAVEPRPATAAPLRDERHRLPARGRPPATARDRQAVGLDVRHRPRGVEPGAGPRPEPL